MATELRLSVRTLQRRLTEQGSTFQGLLEDARRELAHHYLLHSDVELKEAGYLLGYEDANSFSRAFHGWEGVPPGRWRTRRRKSMRDRPAQGPAVRGKSRSRGISLGISRQRARREPS